MGEIFYAGNDDRSAIPAILSSIKLYPIANNLPDLEISKTLDFGAYLLAGNTPSRWSFAIACGVMRALQTLLMSLRWFLPAMLINPDMCAAV